MCLKINKRTFLTQEIKTRFGQLATIKATKVQYPVMTQNHHDTKYTRLKQANRTAKDLTSQVKTNKEQKVSGQDAVHFTFEQSVLNPSVFLKLILQQSQQKGPHTKSVLRLPQVSQKQPLRSLQTLYKCILIITYKQQWFVGSTNSYN